MIGTVLCGVEDSAEGLRALEVAHQMSKRLGLRLVVAHVVEVGGVSAAASGDEVYSRDRTAANALLSRAITAVNLDQGVERRVDVGDAAGRLAQIAAEEAADLIVLGGRRRGAILPRVACALADQLERETTIPVLVALPLIHPRASTAGPSQVQS